MVALRAGRQPSPGEWASCKSGKSGASRVGHAPRALQLLLLTLGVFFASQTLRSGRRQTPAHELPGQALRAAGAAVAAAAESLTSIDEATGLFKAFIDGPTRPQLEKFWRRRLQRLPRRGIAVAAGVHSWHLPLHDRRRQSREQAISDKLLIIKVRLAPLDTPSVSLTPPSPLAGLPGTLANAFVSLYVLRRSLGCQLPISLM